jgi:hypothetical protein
MHGVLTLQRDASTENDFNPFSDWLRVAAPTVCAGEDNLLQQPVH